jgi:hypothetical protein
MIETEAIRHPIDGSCPPLEDRQMKGEEGDRKKKKRNRLENESSKRSSSRWINFNF